MELNSRLSGSMIPDPVDLELRVSTPWGTNNNGELVFELDSPSGAVVELFRKSFSSVRLERPPEAFQAWLFRRLENLGKGLGGDDEPLRPSDVEGELEALGSSLFNELFSDDLRRVLSEIQDEVETLMIVSDEPWIPWELVKPKGRDFLAADYQLTRWLVDAFRPVGGLEIRRLACFESPGKAAELETGPERELLARLAVEKGIDDRSPGEALFRELELLLARGEIDLLHYAGHGDFDAEEPEEAKIILADRSFRALHLAPLQEALAEIRPMVFLNACRVARQGHSLTGLGGWVRGFVRNGGCSVFLGPQWAVPDDLARLFAEVFYKELCRDRDRTVGEAVMEARKALRKKAPGPAWLSYALYSHPGTRLGLGDEESEDEDGATVPRAGVASEIRRRIIDRRGFIAEKTTGFVGRQWVFERISHFVEHSPRGYFMLYGDPGIGKSSLIAQMVKQEKHPHHFNIRAAGMSSAESFLANVSAQLIANHGLRYTSLPHEATRDGIFLRQILEEVAARITPRGEKLLLLVDALDEVDLAGHPEGANPLYLPLSLPKGVYIVVTSRRGTYLRVDCELEDFEIVQDDLGNLADIKVFVESHLERPGILAFVKRRGIEPAAFIDEMVDKSQGNFMYLYHVLPEIERGTYNDRLLTELPSGLQSYYQDHWSRMRSRDENAWFHYQLPVLVALTIIKEPVSMDLIVDFSGVSERRRIRHVLQEWDAFLHKGEVMDETTGRRQKRYRFYHATFHDFIAAKEEVAGEKVDLKAAHGKIADVLWAGFYGEE